MEILNDGNAILKKARETRRARVDKSVERRLESLDTMLALGTTTVEIKSGYGLITEEELKILKATKRIT